MTTQPFDWGNRGVHAACDHKHAVCTVAAGKITIHVHQHDLDQPCPASCPHAGTENDTRRTR